MLRYEFYAIREDGMHKTIMTYGTNMINSTFSSGLFVDNISDGNKFSSVNFVLFYFTLGLCSLRCLEFTQKSQRNETMDGLLTIYFHL